MTPQEVLQLVVNGGGFAVVVVLLMQSQKEAREDREWMKSVLWYLLQKDSPGAIPTGLPGRPPEVAKTTEGTNGQG